MNGINDFLGIAIVGSSLSLVIGFIKQKWGIESNKTKFAVISLSILLGIMYWFLKDTILWQTILGILAAASTFWAMFLKN